jgi:hypothetical protein
VLSLVSERPGAVADPKPRTVTRWGWGANPHSLGHKPLYPKELLEAGGIEPRTLDLQVLLRQALARVGQEGLASCLALLCSELDFALVVEACPGLPACCRRLILDAVDEGGANERCQGVPRGANVPRGVAEQTNVCIGRPDRPSGGAGVNR